MTTVLLDVTRTLSPKSLDAPTGIDRVEKAYISKALSWARPTLFLYRDSYLDTDGMKSLMMRISGETDWGRADLRGWGRGLKGRIESDIRRLKVERPQTPHAYINVGHTNLESLAQIGAASTIGLVHDMIPLDHPEFQTPASIVRFETRIRALAENATTIFVNSKHTKERLQHWCNNWRCTPEIIVNRLGVAQPPDVEAKTFDRPAFLALGTIEPRKNHALLLNIWSSFTDMPEAERPQLHIIGRRGWMNADVFQFLDTSPMMGQDIFEHGVLSDAEVTAFLKGAHALLFPSFAEGFGFPLLEALNVGTKTIVSDIPAFRELAGPSSLYLNPLNVSNWRNEIIKHIELGNTEASQVNNEQFKSPGWDDHFALLESHL